MPVVSVLTAWARTGSAAKAVHEASRAARSSHPDFAGDVGDRKLFQGASLDHSVWFERPTDPSQWHWFATRSHGVNRGRGLVTGDVIRHDGLQVATIAQEVLVRRRRDA